MLKKKSSPSRPIIDQNCALTLEVFLSLHLEKPHWVFGDGINLLVIFSLHVIPSNMQISFLNDTSWENWRAPGEPHWTIANKETEKTPPWPMTMCKLKTSRPIFRQGRNGWIFRTVTHQKTETPFAPRCFRPWPRSVSGSFDRRADLLFVAQVVCFFSPRKLSQIQWMSVLFS